MTRNIASHSRHKGNTAVLFIIIILFAVGAVLFLKSANKAPTGPVEEYPWVETNRIVDDSSMIALSEPPQYVIEKEKILTYRITSDDGQNRGKLDILLSPDGTVTASWQASYKEDIYEKDFSAACEGNIDASKLYDGENGTDPEKLFFITEGSFLLQAFKHGNATASGGEAYVIGWINPDGTASGTLVLTPDKKTTRIYHWGT
jgi:hypothetical protein